MSPLAQNQAGFGDAGQLFPRRHRCRWPPPDGVASAPVVLLAAAAARTKRIRLASAVSVLSSDDRVRVFQPCPRWTGSRRAGRGSPSAAAHSSSPLPCSVSISTTTKRCSRKTRVAAHAARPHARALGRPASRHAVASGRLCPPVQHPLPVWIGVGGTPQSSVRVGTLGLRLMLAIIGGHPAQFRSLIDLTARQARGRGALRKNSPSASTPSVFWPIRARSRRRPSGRPTGKSLAGSAGNAAGQRRPDQSLTRNAVRLECGGSVTPRASPKRWFRRIVCSAVRRD